MWSFHLSSSISRILPCLASLKPIWLLHFFSPVWVRLISYDAEYEEQS